MSKMVNRKSQTKLDDNRQTFVKNDGGFHPESDSDLREYTHPGKVNHSYDEFRRAQGDDVEKTADAGQNRQQVLLEKNYTLLQDIYTLVRHPRITLQKIREFRTRPS